MSISFGVEFAYTYIPGFRSVRDTGHKCGNHSHRFPILAVPGSKIGDELFSNGIELCLAKEKGRLDTIQDFTSCFGDR
jgi:hypothetical protein